MWNSGPAVTIIMGASTTVGVGITTLLKAAMREGLSPYVFVVYSNLLAMFMLVPACFIFYRKRARPQLTRVIVFKIFLLGLSSCGVQTFMNTGISFSSPTMSAAMTDLSPAFTFLMALLSRMEILDLRLRSSQAKSVGTMVSVTGALIITFYKGLPLTSLPSKSASLNLPILLSTSNWAIGGILCAAGALCLSLMYVSQTWILRDYPAELIVTSMSCGFVLMLSTIIGLFAETNFDAWMLKPDLQLVSILLAAFFAVSVRGLVHVWSCGLKGPLYTAMFTPVGTLIATALGVTFLGDTLYAGSILGAVIITFGFYTVLWGKAQEEKKDKEERDSILESPSSPKAPLLQNKSLDV